eukprot:512797_1
MRYIAAYLLSKLGGKEEPSAKDVESILSSVGIECDSARLEKLVGELKGKNLDTLIAEGSERLSSVAVASGGGGAGGAGGAAAEEAVKEESEVEESEESMGGGMGLFGSDSDSD